MADAVTGDVRDVMEETVTTHFESVTGWQVLWATNEVLWYSQRDDWGHLYLYDLTTGQLKQQITKGAWNVLHVRRVDEATRTIYFTGAGREPGDPYFEYFYSVKFDGSALTLLTPERGNHTITLSPSEKVFVDSWSTPAVPPVTGAPILTERAGGQRSIATQFVFASFIASMLTIPAVFYLFSHFFPMP